MNQTLAIDTIYIGPATCEPVGYVSAQISGQTGVPQYTWSGPGPNSPNFINASVFQDLPSGWYYINVVDNVCEVNDSAFVDILNPPIAQVSANPIVGCSPLQVTFTNTSQNAASFEWDFGNGQVITVNDLGSQTVTFTESSVINLTAFQDANCFDEASVAVVISVCGCTDPSATNYDPTATADDGSCLYPIPTVYVPNVFSPNEDQDNDFFFLTTTNALSVELTVLNRWGNVMFEGSGINPAWNGKADNGLDAEDGVYFYKYKVTGYLNNVLEGHGFLHLVR
jgi:gliding motility-associated-like protein